MVGGIHKQVRKDSSVHSYINNNTVALKILPVMGIRRRVSVSAHEKRPPLDYGQMAAWNGGAEGKQQLRLFVTAK